MFFQNKKIVFFFVLLLFCTKSCLSPFQTNGSCTKCLPTQNLQNGFCYLKIRGCLTQKGTNCANCQAGYILTQNQCIRQAQYLNLTTLIPSPQKIEESKISQSQITPVMVGGFKETNNFNAPTYLQAQAILYKQYPILSGFKIQKVQEQLVNGINFIFYIINVDNNDLYLAKVYVTFQLQASIQEIYKNNVSIKKGFIISNHLSAPIPGGWQQFTNFKDPRYTQSLALVKSTFLGLDSYKLSRVEYHVVAGILYAFFYNSDTKNNAFIVEVYKPFYGKSVIQNTWGQKPTNIPLVSSGSNFQPSLVAGGAQNLPSSEFNSEPFLTAKSAILKEFPNFDVSLVKSISQQVVAGYNVFISFTLPGLSDIYDVIVFVPLPYTGDPPSLSSIKKNGVLYTPLSSSKLQKPISTTESSSEVQQVSPIVGGFVDTTNFNSDLFIQAKKTLFLQYRQLQGFQITKVQQQIVNGINYVFQFLDTKTGDKYVAKVYVNFQLQVTIDSLTKNNVDVKNYQFGGVEQQTQVHSNQVKVSTNPVAGGFELGGYSRTTDLTSEFYLKANSTLFSEYPFLQGLTIQKVQQQIVSGKNYLITIINQTNSDTYIARVYVTLSLQASVEEITKNNVSIKKNQSIINNSQTQIQTVPLISLSTQQNQQPVITSSTGSNQTISPSEYHSKQFLPIIQAIEKIIPNFDTKFITKITKQIVAGSNYFVTFSLPNSKDFYQLQVYEPLPYTGLNPSVQSVKKNNVSYDLSNSSKVNNQIYSWQNDNVFLQLFKFLKKQININNLLPILQVTRQAKQNNAATWVEYKITFSKEQYVVCRYYQKYQLYEVISYVISGIEMYSVSGREGYGVYDRTENALIDKIKEKDVQKFGKIMVKDINVIKLSDYYRIYKLNGYTFEGHYELIFLDKGELSLIQTNKIDQSTCYAIDNNRQVQYRQEYIIDQIRAFLFAKYNLTGFEVTLAVGSAMNSATNQYIMLLTRSDLKKVGVLVEESDDKYVIRKIDVLNQGLGLISDSLFQKSIDDIARKEYPKDLSGYERILVTSNGTLNVVKFASQTALITYTKSFFSNISKQQFSKSNSCLSIKSLTLDNCQKCNENDLLWKGKCYSKIPNCLLQVGSICAACDKNSIDSNGKCIKDCSIIFSL